MFNDGHCGNWAGLQRRLGAGLPVNMLAFGSSIVGSSGGCTRPVPGVCAASSCPNCCGLSCGQDRGWARAVFDEFNSSWPHADSALYSLGQPGGGLVETLQSCLRDYVMQLRVDVFLLELAVISDQGQRDILRALPAKLDTAVRLILADQQRVHGHRPLILFVSFNYMDGAVGADGACRRRDSFYKVALRTAAVQATAVRWGLPHWSPWPQYSRLSSRTKRSLWQPDLLHPRTDVPLTALAAPIHSAIARGVRECSGPDHADAAPPPEPAVRPPPHWTCLRWKPNGTFAARGSQVASSFRVLGFSRGWRNVTHEAGAAGHWRVKPGLRSEVNGSWWRVAVRTPHAEFVLRLEYLTSYQGLGAAAVSCHAGCACAPRTINATTLERVSVSSVVDVAARRAVGEAGSAPCVLELEVVEPAFKLSSLAVSADAAAAAAARNASGRLQSRGSLAAGLDGRAWARAAWMDADNMMRYNGMHRSSLRDISFNGLISESRPAWLDAAQRPEQRARAVAQPHARPPRRVRDT